MDYHQIAVGVHLLGFALGLGGATISDITFLKTIKAKSLSQEKYEFFEALSIIIWVGLGLLIISGGIMFALIYAEQGSLPLLASPRWQTKLTLVAIVLINGFYFKSAIFPALRSLIGSTITKTQITPLLNKLTISGTISILSWYSVFIISLLPRTFRPPYLAFMGVYFLLLIIGVVFSRYVLTSMFDKN